MPGLVLNSLYSFSRPWTCDHPALASWVDGIVGMCHYTCYQCHFIELHKFLCSEFESYIWITNESEVWFYFQWLNFMFNTFNAHHGIVENDISKLYNLNSLVYHPIMHLKINFHNTGESLKIYYCNFTLEPQCWNWLPNG